jgi:hypothetical protein
MQFNNVTLKFLRVTLAIYYQITLQIHLRFKCYVLVPNTSIVKYFYVGICLEILWKYLSGIAFKSLNILNGVRELLVLISLALDRISYGGIGRPKFETGSKSPKTNLRYLKNCKFTRKLLNIGST